MERDLLDRLELGDPSAFDDLVGQYHPAVYHFAYRLTHDRATAEDVAQEVFVRAYRGLGGFRRASSLKTWLFRIAIRAASDARHDVSPLTTLAAPVPVEPDALASLERAELEAELARAIARLSGKQRATLVLRVSHDLPFREIAEVMGASLGTVKATYHQAVSRLRELIGTPRPVPKAD